MLSIPSETVGDILCPERMRWAGRREPSSNPQVRQSSPEDRDLGQILKTGSNYQDEEWKEGLCGQNESECWSHYCTLIMKHFHLHLVLSQMSPKLLSWAALYMHMCISTWIPHRGQWHCEWVTLSPTRFFPLCSLQYWMNHHSSLFYLLGVC